MGINSTELKTRLYITFFLILMAQLYLVAQIKINRTLGVEDGLIQSTVRVIYKDSNGYLWFGTNLGVSRWDGQNFINYSPSDGLPGHVVYSIDEDKQGHLYFGTSGGIAMFANNRFVTLNPPDSIPTFHVRCVASTINGEILFGTNNGIYTIVNGALKLLLANPPGDNSEITSACTTADGRIIFGNDKNNVFEYKSGKFTRLNIGAYLFDGSINSITELRNGSLVFGLATSFVVYTNNELSSDNHMPKDIGKINTIIECEEGLYICTQNAGIIIWDEKQKDKITMENGLTSNDVVSAFRDTDGTVYFGLSNGGVNILNRYRILIFNERVGLQNRNVTTICEDNGGKFYIGTRENGIAVFEGSAFHKANTIDEVCCSQILSSCRDVYGNLYFGTNGGLNILSKNGIEIINKANGLPTNVVFNVNTGPDNSIYIATQKGLCIYKSGKIKLYSKQQGLGDNFVTSTAYSSSDSSLYIGTYFNGVTIFKNNQFKIINKKNGLSGNSVFSIYESADHGMCVGTATGLNIITKKGIKIYNNKNGLIGSTIYSITEDNNGRLFLGTNKGVNVLDFSNDSLKVFALLTEDGVSGDECNMGAIYKDSKGYIWVGTIKGTVRFDPDKITPNKVPPKLQITSVDLFDTPIQDFQNISGRDFAYDQNTFRFNFFGINLSSPKRVRYRYRLIGLNNTWTISALPTVQFTNLDNGEYTFQVEAGNEWGYWSEPAAVSLSIARPLWEQWWFILLVILFIGGSVAYFIYRRIHALLALERLRLKIAADLHDNIGAGLTEIYIMSQVVQDKINKGDSAVENYLSVISTESKQLIDNMRDIVWIVNPKQDSLFDLIIRLRDSFSEIFNSRNISFRTENLEVLKKVILSMTYRSNIYMIFKEALNNCLKHSKCTDILLSVNMTGRILEISLLDNGIGINEKGKHNGNGLLNMRERAVQLGGALIIESGKDFGTRIKFICRISN